MIRNIVNAIPGGETTCKMMGGAAISGVCKNIGINYSHQALAAGCSLLAVVFFKALKNMDNPSAVEAINKTINRNFVSSNIDNEVLKTIELAVSEANTLEEAAQKVRDYFSPLGDSLVPLTVAAAAYAQCNSKGVGAVLNVIEHHLSKSFSSEQDKESYRKELSILLGYAKEDATLENIVEMMVGLTRAVEKTD